MAKRVARVVPYLLILVGVGSVAWMAFGLPPVTFVAHHGLRGPRGPTGRTARVEGVTFVEIAGGYGRMGSDARCAKGDILGRVCAAMQLPWGRHPESKGDEVPIHWVRFPKGYWVATTEITNEQYEMFDPRHARPEWSPGDRMPVVGVSYTEARAYCGWLSARGSLDVRLPSEAEWEIACRAGSEAEFCYGNGEDGLSEYAWFDRNSGGRAHEVGTRRPNRWGLHDFHGNVWEWCEDTYHENYRGAPSDGRAWIEGGVRWEDTADRVCRGGGWGSPAPYCRSAIRYWDRPSFRFACLGLRPAADSR